jgi:hypothetical protein
MWITGGAVAVVAAATAVGTMTTGKSSPTSIPHRNAAVAPATAVNASTTALSSSKLSLKGQYQQTTYYCVPASESMTLSTFGIKVGQATLAKKMGTTSSKGTSGANAVSVVNGYLKPKGYKLTIVKDVAGNPTVLMNRASYDIGVLHRAPVIGVWMEKLPWNKGKVKGTKIGHAMVVYGYDKAKGTVTVFDPWKATGGTHTISAKTLAGALQASGGMHYISRSLL